MVKIALIGCEHSSYNEFSEYCDFVLSNLLKKEKNIQICSRISGARNCMRYSDSIKCHYEFVFGDGCDFIKESDYVIVFWNGKSMSVINDSNIAKMNDKKMRIHTIINPVLEEPVVLTELFADWGNDVEEESVDPKYIYYGDF